MMSEVKLVLRDATETKSGTIHGSCVEHFVAALSSDPVTLNELNSAIDRFAMSSPDNGHFPWFHSGMDDEPWDAGLVVIDLAAKLVVQDSTYSWSPPQGHIEYTEPETDFRRAVGYALTDEWLFTNKALDWQAIADCRRADFAAEPQVDVRAVVYGDAMMSFAIRECVSEFRRRDEIRERVHREMIERTRRWNQRYAETPRPDPETQTLKELAGLHEGQQLYTRVFYDTVRDIHASWLMTPCPELRGEIPRDVLRRFRSHISGDLCSREYQWTMSDRCPPGLSPESHAFQFGGFGTNELVMYYDYVREVLWACWGRLEEMSQSTFDAINIDDYIAAQLPHLREVAERWLNSPWEETPHKTPRQIIDRERARLPDGGSYVPIDPDCPCCQGLAEMPGIGFWHLDGCNQDDLFAFSLFHETYEEWHQEQLEYEARSIAFDAEQQLRKEWNLPSEFCPPPDDADDIWGLQFNTPEGDLLIGHRLLVVANRTVGLIVAIRLAGEEAPARPTQALTTEVERCYRRLRSACAEVDAGNAEELLRPLLTAFNNAIVNVNFDEQTARSSGQLFDALASFLRCTPIRPDWSDDDVPF